MTIYPDGESKEKYRAIVPLCEKHRTELRSVKGNTGQRPQVDVSHTPTYQHVLDYDFEGRKTTVHELVIQS